ncbi:unnamed protein product [Eruca vesicaria subsp. sativa]|uniref:Uncharacterized protein n=1 Tax=Eruca vesicaria subsp. sativa TaxID=29727 RepID=A0ABC8J1I9_ERUVS|nr:unnamed protein product [Eruca vesicaria subsp. sativa]
MRSGSSRPTFKNPMRSRLLNTTLPDQGLPSTVGSGSSAPTAPSYQSFTQSTFSKDNFCSSGGISKDLDFVRGVIEDDEGRRASGPAPVRA